MIYNGTHRFLEESEEEFQRHEPCDCYDCGGTHQLKNMIYYELNEYTDVDLCKPCYKKRLEGLK